ncbi:extracellular solute-binding protein [Paenibacillus agilis]|uniref:Extracellular solute-binding protein n=1 Tax=Paenibacillus agilis TaxID=3020863 RepID=A0A559J0U6_9BACL|nr:extracellular solute-binding protein [Paenibacillus agilis]TVX93497.1 extracellular solute-binding protein [Paenibacillus agilis]
MFDLRNTNPLTPQEVNPNHQSASIVIHSLNFTFPKGMDENNNPYLHYIEDKTNIDIRVKMPPVTTYEDTLKVELSNATPPDMLTTYVPKTFYDLVERGELAPLDELIASYGADLQKYIPEEAWATVRVNGHIYAIPTSNDASGEEVIYVRKDWLDNLNLDIPTTIDEIAHVIHAFTRQDPDRNGKADTYGITWMPHLNQTSPLLGAFGVQFDHWINIDGQLAYANILPGMKEAISFLAALNKEKLVKPFISFSSTRTDWLHHTIVDNNVGMFSGSWDHRILIHDLQRKNGVEAEWIAIDAPIGRNGERSTKALPLVKGYQLVPKNSANKAEVIKLLNFIVEEGRETLDMGFEHQVWQRQGEEIVYDSNENKKAGYRGMYAILANVQNREVYEVSFKKNKALVENLRKAERFAVESEFTSYQTPTMKSQHKQLEQLKDVFDEMISGQASMDEFDRYVNEWKALGGDQITKEVNEWYASNRANKK